MNVAKDPVSEAPRIDADGHLSSTESAELYQHYGLPMPRTAPDANAGRGKVDTTTGRGKHDIAAGRDKMDTAAGRGTQDAAMAREGHSVADAGSGTRGEEMIRSEERLNVGTEQVKTGHVRLRKYVVTEAQAPTDGIPASRSRFS